MPCNIGEQMAFLSFFCVDPHSGAVAIAAFNTLGLGTEDRAAPDTRRVRADIRALVLSEMFPLFR